MKNSIKLSQELSNYFKKAHEEALVHHEKEVVLDHVISQIVVAYLDGDGEIQELTEYFDNLLDKSQKESIIDTVMDIVYDLRDTNKFTAPDKLYTGDDYLATSPVINHILSKIDILNMGVIKEVDSLAFLMCAIPEVSFSNIVKHLLNYGIETKKLTEIYWKLNEFDKKIGEIKKNVINYNSSSKLKEKTVSYDEDEDGLEEENSEKKREEDDREFEMAGQGGSNEPEKVDPNSKTPFLDKFSTDMTLAAKNEEYDPIVGRDKEISQIIEILSCRKKNNGILLAEAGCGKTAIIEGLCQKIANKEVPRELVDKRILSLDLNALVAGCQFRGQYEERLDAIIKEVENNPEIIIYIDEIHNLVGNGSNDGKGDGANILKGPLARGKFKCLGSTTVKEYKKYIEKDSALKRRFQTVTVDEPNKEETFEILKTLKGKYEEYHKVKYTDNILKLCVDLSERYIYDRHFPDKAIDCMDIAASAAKHRKNIDTSSIENLEKAINDIIKEKVELVEKQDFDEAQKKRDTEMLLKSELEAEKAKLDCELNDSSRWTEVTEDDVMTVVSKISNVPVNKMKDSETVKIRNMKKVLEKEVIGQQDAVDTMVTAIQKSILDIQDPNKPICTAFLVGPTGSGKTLISKKIAELFFESVEKNLLLINMGEYTESYSISRLLGSAPGYVGSDSDTAVFEKVRTNPNMVVVFDEIEKAHKDIYDLLLGILDTGKANLSNGLEVSFKNCIILLSSNIGSKQLSEKGNGLGFSKQSQDEKNKDNKSIVMKAMEKFFRPEFIGRLSNIVIFNELGKPEMIKIFDLEIKKLSDRLFKKGYKLNISEKLKEFIIDQVNTKYGARDLSKNISKYVEDKLALAMVNGEVSGNIINLDLGSNSEVIVSNPIIELDINK